jgi:hypothetical protein
MLPNPQTEWDDSTMGLPDEWDADSRELLDPDASTAPSLPIILFSAAGGIAGAVIALYVATQWLELGLELSAAIATLGLLFSLGISGAVLSALTGSRAAPVNILFSCGLILLAVFFLALCLLAGALVGVVLVQF